MDKRIISLDILLILRKYSDNKHPLGLSNILKLLKDEYDEEVCRQTVRKYLDDLVDAGIDIKKNKSKYYLNEREFEKEEIELLCHSVMASNTIPLTYTKELIDKLKNTQSIYFANNKNLEFNIYNSDKRNNKDLFYNIYLISEAIDEGIYLEFDYQRYNYKAELVTNNKRYKVIPLRTVSMQGRYYLITYNEKHQNYTHYRIDKIVNVEKGEKYKDIKSLDLDEYTKNRLYMHAGELIEFEIIFDDVVIDEIIDLFGSDINIKCIGDNKYQAKLMTTKAAIKYFAYQYLEHVIVIKPKNISDEIKDKLEKTVGRYSNIKEL